MKRVLALALILLALILGGYFLNSYWVHRYDPLIARQAAIYRLDPDLVWSIIYEETYFSPWKVGKDGEIGLMQVTPAVGREWATETGMRELERQMNSDPKTYLHDPEHNIQIGCWYLEKIRSQFQDVSDTDSRIVAGYNAGPSRAIEWGRANPDGRVPNASEFVARIDIPSTRAYVTSIISRYHQLKSAKGQTVSLETPTPVSR